MVKLVKGCLLKTEPNIKEIIMLVAEHAIIEVLNETTIFIKEEFYDEIKTQVEKILSNASKQIEKQ